MTKEETLALALEGCGSCNHVELHKIPKIDDIQEITNWYYREGGYGPEHDLAIVALLKDGRWIAIEEWEDTSGHGCQCDAQLEYFPTKEEALRLGISTSIRDNLNEEPNTNAKY